MHEFCTEWAQKAPQPVHPLLDLPDQQAPAAERGLGAQGQRLRERPQKPASPRRLQDGRWKMRLLFFLFLSFPFGDVGESRPFFVRRSASHSATLISSMPITCTCTIFKSAVPQIRGDTWSSWTRQEVPRRESWGQRL